MRTKHWLGGLSVLLMFSILVFPALAACMGNILSDYINNPKGTTAPGVALANCQLAIVKIVAVHPDPKPKPPWGQTGELDLRRIDSTGKSLPVTFSISYDQRPAGEPDCETWDYVHLKPGGKLLAFFRTEGGKWVIPELPAFGVVSNMERLSPAAKKQLQPFFHTRL